MLVKENKKFVKLKDAFALEVEKCKNLTKELNACNDSFSCLRTENVSLIAKIEELNACNFFTSTIEHVTICTRCKDINVDAYASGDAYQGSHTLMLMMVGFLEYLPLLVALTSSV